MGNIAQCAMLLLLNLAFTSLEVELNQLVYSVLANVSSHSDILIGIFGTKN